jgi:hypothetical protein
MFSLMLCMIVFERRQRTRTRRRSFVCYIPLEGHCLKVQKGIKTHIPALEAIKVVESRFQFWRGVLRSLVDTAILG